MRSKEFLNDAESVSFSSVFGSEAHNALTAAGINFKEKPSHWSELADNPLGDDGLQKVKKALANAEIRLEEYAAWEIYPINPDRRGDRVKGPLQSVENMPDPSVFIIYDLPYSDERGGEPKVGTFLVDRTGASSYIRFWRQIN